MMEGHVCGVCGYVYEEDQHGPFEDQHEDWACPHCGSEIDMFEKKEIE